MNRIDKRFRELRERGRKALVVFITAGYPDLAATRRMILEFDRIGVDCVELGIPFSDPMADGPVIQESSQAALKKGVTLEKVFALVKDVRRKSGIPICFMSYYNPVYAFGEERFFKAAKSCGVDGVIIPDLAFEETAGFSRAGRRAGVKTIFFVSPTTTPARAKKICRMSSGFIYYISLAGVTGERAVLPKELAEGVKKVKRLTDTPVCVGFGVSSRAQVKAVSRFSDGVIVGSAVVRAVRENRGNKDLAVRVSALVRNLRGGWL
jgi:tryptophan synthase alpha chain